MAEEEPLLLTPTKLSKERKVGFILLLIFSVTAVSLGILQIRNTLYEPFALNNKIPSFVKDQVNIVDALRYRDTDFDGLTDFDELYIYGTSPYLYDTFSYGMSDKEVVAKGLPLCAGNGLRRDCIDTGTGAAVTPSSSANVIPLPADLKTPPMDLNELLSSPTEIRAALIAAGLDKKVLDKVSDSDLLKMARSVSPISSSSISTNINLLNSIINTTTTATPKKQ